MTRSGGPVPPAFEGGWTDDASAGHGETVLQLHEVGPWAIEYVDPKDDPRKRN